MAAQLPLEQRSDDNMRQQNPQTGGQKDEETEEQQADEHDRNGRLSEREKRHASSGINKVKDATSTLKHNGPEGGFDSTPIPPRPAGYTLRITLHCAENLPMADLNALSCDPYCLLQMNADTPQRHKEDPCLRWRTTTVHRNTEPTWDEEWIVANVPASGFKLKIRVYDEDVADKDDLLGKVHLTLPSLDENWKGIKRRRYKLMVHDGSSRAYLLQAITVCLQQNKHLRGSLYLSVEMLGRTPEDGQAGRMYTVGPCRWFRHYSPLLGRLANIKEPSDSGSVDSPNSRGKPQKKVQQYNFQANQFQLQGPVPAKLYHRFVEFKPWVGRMFTRKGLSGMIMGKALHHQHSRVYNFGRSTAAGVFPQGPCEEMTQKFLELVHSDQGGRIFTYVITLDGLWRFTETGKEFGIDMLSKHTMHSDVSIYIAFSGEFFVRRLKHPRRPPSLAEIEQHSMQTHAREREKDEENALEMMADGPRDDDHDDHDEDDDDEPPHHPNHYQLVIDNDSGTYRPNADLLPLLKSFLAKQLPGLHILTLDCNADAEKQQRMKKEQRELKKSSGEQIIYTQRSRSSSISSSDMSDLDEVQAGLSDESVLDSGGGIVRQTVKGVKLANQALLDN